MQSGILSPDLLWRNLIPVVMAGVNGIYGLITSIILIASITGPTNNGYNTYSLYTGCAHLAAGLCCGLSGLGSGICIGIGTSSKRIVLKTNSNDANDTYLYLSGVAGECSVMTCGAFDWSIKKAQMMLMRGRGKPGFAMPRSRNKKTEGGGDKIFVCMVLVQVFAGNIALYGMIASILLSQQQFYCESQ